MKNVIITGCCGFIGYHTALKFLNDKKYKIIGIDNLNNYYDIKLKQSRLKLLNQYSNFHFKKIDITNYKKLFNLLNNLKIDYIIHLAAQAGVRNSIKFPNQYFTSNIQGFHNILEISKFKKINHLLFASTSSVYGNSSKFPLKENYNTDRPNSFYAASKKSNEITAYSYSRIHKIPTTGLRFFTVYGPYGRPDMSLFKFTKSILENKPIDLYNKGKHERDFTYVEDVANIIYAISKKIPRKPTFYRILNIASSRPIKLKRFLSIIEKNTNKKFKIKLLPLQVGDVKKTHASNYELLKLIKYKNFTTIEKGVKNFVQWYKSYYKIK